MRQLRLLTRTDDGGHLVVETEDGLERFALPVDATLRVTVGAPTPEPVAPLSSALAPTAPTAPQDTAAAADTADAAPQRNAEATSPLPELGPREIQVRVRAGASPQELAEAHGMTLERVLRFATPVVAERMRITDEARRARARRTGAEGTEPVVVQFGEAVDDRFTAHGVDATAVTWNSRRRDDGEWLVAATWLGGDGEHGAEWAFHRGSRSVTPLDDTAADLLSSRPIRPVSPPASPITAPRLASGVIAFPPFPDAHTGPMKRIEDVFDQEAPTDGPVKLPPYRPETGTTATPVDDAGEHLPSLIPGGSLEFEEPPLPLAISDAAGRPAAAGRTATLHTLGSRREETEDDKATRARIPSWDDILLGVRRKQD